MLKNYMDFKHRDYYLIEKGMLKNASFGSGHIAAKIKKYFNCKMRCHQYIYDDECYTYCVSIDKTESKHLVAYLKDNNIKYQQITTEPKRETYFRFSWTSKERLEEIERLKKETDKLKQVYDYVKIRDTKLAATITDISDIDVNRIFVSGINKDGENEKVEVKDKLIIQMIVNILLNELETIWEEI